MKKANANLIKEINLNNVRQAMKRVETATKPQLAALTKLSVVTVNSLVKELHDLGEIFEDETVPSNGGRPALTYRYNYDFSLALVIYMKETQGQELISAAVVNLEDHILQKEEYVMPVFDRQQFYDMIERFLTLYPSIKVIGIGIPGQAVNGEITVSAHQALMGVRMIEDIETQFGLPVMVENDVNAAISGYCANRDPDDEQCVLGIYFPAKYPPGMGIYLDGKVFKGKNGMAGEIKFLPMDVDWYHEMDKETFVGSVCQVIQSVNAVLAPDKIVIYQDMVGADIWNSAWEAYRTQHPMPSYPEVILQETFQQDFETGMRWLTLKELEPALSHFN
ncbi:MAG: ROK family protein [Paenibacillus macerans]|uniref:ROK family protein n=1 Tax=Paenibacillus macerans TaxID=44252 RepID=A0A091A7T8_PAEMA|nr:ROK family protein [Paenibacillus macerans]KFN12301.1 ROK family protein [Paenibacillus macerans]MBS5911814.1 ROK family protein [Paenibacillus macerans]MDU5948961.1 ROK family protein [Paenibacillus macerans]MDU7472226.1 ROK family protein [Paenibacillus macerans]MEC0140410.1 ROK family protein [Paenibacillus macerans]